MRTLYLDRKNAELALDAGALLVRVPGERPARVPLAGLERVIVKGEAKLSSGLLAALHEADVGLLVLSGRRAEPKATLLGRPHADVRLRLAQFEAARDPQRRLALARPTVLAKLDAQMRLLARALEARPDRRGPLAAARDAIAARQEQARSADLAALLGCEGAAAAAYFDAFATLFPPALGMQGRNRRPPKDPVNAALSLGYTLATHAAARAVAQVGLDPLLGFLHAPAFDRPALACDLVEPVRSHIDELVWRLFAERRLRAEGFRTDQGGCLMSKAARETFYAAYEEELAALPRLLRQMASGLARELRRAPLPEWLGC
ncbi:MAG: CRISPR-associated endonuclease Cas1 [Geminicoccaceae bacterium]|nr:CRISPR-associated endonuclease Cas1 [Geminicoccaceae bacterium]MDW8371696.1 CRISPR-associated endonuclease Cas1 [Geminicoccaceae bacterium]